MGMFAAVIAIAILVAIWHRQEDGEAPLYLLLVVSVPIGLVLASIGIGLLMQGTRNNIRMYLLSYAAADYAETKNLIVNLSKLIADVQHHAPPADRRVSLQVAICRC